MELYEISLLTSLWIIIIFAVLFFGLLYLNFIKRKKILKNGLGDEEILKNLRKKYRQFFYDKWQISKKNSSVPLYILANSPTLIAAKNNSGKLDESQSLVSTLSKTRGKISGWSMFGVGICAVLIAVCSISATAGVYYKINERPFVLNNIEYRVLKTDGLDDSTKEVSIKKNSLVSFKRDDFSSIKEGDIIAYYTPEFDAVNINRVVKVENVDGSILFECQDYKEETIDAKNTGIDEKRYLGKYSGYNNYGLGVTFGFVASDFGIVSLYFMALAIYFYTYCFADIDFTYSKREFYLAQGVDEQNERSYKEEIARLNNSNKSLR